MRRRIIGSSFPFSVGGSATPVADPNWKTIFEAPLTSNFSTGANTFRLSIPPSLYAVTAPIAGTRIRVTMQAHSSGGSNWNSVYAGHGAPSGDAIDFDATQIQLTFNAGSPSGTSPAGGSVVSDGMTYAFNGTKPFNVGAYGGGNVPYATVTGAGFGLYTLGDKANVTDVTIGAGEFIGSPDTVMFFSKIEVYDTSTPSAEVQQFLARVAPQPVVIRSVYQNLINGLVADGVWPLLDAVYWLAGMDLATSLVNLKQNSYSGVTVGVPTFTPYQGIIGGGSYIDTGYNPSTAGGNFPATGTSGTMAAYVRGSITLPAGGYAIECGKSNGECAIYIHPSATQGTIGGDGPSQSVSPVGNYVITRRAANAAQLFKNGATLGALYTFSSTTPPSSDKIALLAQRDGANGTDGQVVACAFGAAMTDAQAIAYMNRVQAAATALGINTY